MKKKTLSIAILLTVSIVSFYLAVCSSISQVQAQVPGRGFTLQNGVVDPAILHIAPHESFFIRSDIDVNVIINRPSTGATVYQTFVAAGLQGGVIIDPDNFADQGPLGAVYVVNFAAPTLPPHTIGTLIISQCAVGGIVIPVDKFALLAPFIGLASTILVATVATTIYIKRGKLRKEKQ